MLSKLFYPMPIYTTNADANGLIGTYTAPAVFVLIAVLFGVLNAVLWGGIGIVQAIQFILG